jgi:hypothetical protein
MRNVFSRGRVTAAVWLLLVVLLAPSAFASDATTDATLWAEFVAWFEARLDVPNGVTTADESSFTLWLMGRLHIPNG